MTLYVSNEASNGLPIGNDANAGTEAAPLLTVNQAESNRSTNEDIFINGDFTESTLVKPATGDVVNIRSYVPGYSTITAGTTGAYWCNMSSVNANSGFGFYDLTIVSDNPTVAMFNHSGSGAVEYTWNNCTVSYSGATDTGIFSSSSGTGNMTINWINSKFVVNTPSAAFNGLLRANTALDTANFNLENVEIDINARAVTGRGFIVCKVITAGTFRCVGLAGTYFNRSDSGADFRLFDLQNFAGALLDGLDGVVTLRADDDGGGSIVGFSASPDSDAIASHGCIIRNIRPVIDGLTGGILCLIGRDAPDANADDMCNWGVISRIKTTGQGSATNTIHGPMISNVTGGGIVNCESEGMDFGFITKGVTDALVTNNKSRNPVGLNQQCLRIKGGSGFAYTRNELEANNAGSTLIRVDDSAADAYVVNNQLTVGPDAAPDQIITVDAGSTVTFYNNNYTIDAGATLPTNDFSYQGVNYADIAAWEAAQEPTLTEGSIDRVSLSSGGGGFLPIFGDSKMKLQPFTADLTTDGSGDASVEIQCGTGALAKVLYEPGTIDTGATITLTSRDTGETLYSKANAGTTDVTAYPRRPTQSSTDGSDTGANEMAFIDGPIIATISSGGSTNAGSVTVWLAG